MKGQWFIVSAVVASTVFFGLSVMLKDYFSMDSSVQASVNNDFYFYDIGQQFDHIVATTTTDANCANLTMNLDELRAVSERYLEARGYLVYMNYTIAQPCATGANSVELDFLIASENGIIYNLSTMAPSQVIGTS